MTFTEFSDLIKIGLFLLACLFTRQAAYVLCLHAVNVGLFYLAGHDPIIYYCTVATLYAIACNANITLLSEIRYVLLAFAVINWIAAIDYLLSPYQTLFGMCYPWLVNGFDVLILFLLFRHRGKECDGRSRSDFNMYLGASASVIHNFNLWLARLYLLQRFKKQDPK
jgi:hypothetical protein